MISKGGVHGETSVKLPGHPVKTGQARRGRSVKLTALSMSNGLPGKAVSFILPLDPAYKAGLVGHVPAKRSGGVEWVLSRIEQK